MEELPDPFAPLGPRPGATPDIPELEEKPRRRRWWPMVLYAVSGVFFVTLIWLTVTAPLSRALEHCRTGVLLDGKTEIALRRLAERYPSGGAA